MTQLLLEKIIKEGKTIKKEQGIKYIKVGRTIYSIILFIDKVLDCMANYERRLPGKYRIISNDYRLIE